MGLWNVGYDDSIGLRLSCGGTLVVFRLYAPHKAFQTCFGTGTWQPRLEPPIVRCNTLFFLLPAIQLSSRCNSIPFDPLPLVSMASCLTTRAQIWSDSMPETPPPWIDRGDGFHLEFGEDEELPLRYMNNMASPGNNVNVDQYECTKTKQRVAIKSMDTFSRPATIDTMNKEVRILRRVNHYHSIRALGSYTHQDKLCIITQPAALCDLREYLFEDNSRKTRKMVNSYGPRSDFLPRLMGCLAHGLQYIHGRKGATSTSGAQVRHRDIKPANILLDGGRVVFADFGISREYTLTQTGTTGPSQMTMMVTCKPMVLAGSGADNS